MILKIINWYMSHYIIDTFYRGEFYSFVVYTFIPFIVVAVVIYGVLRW